MRPTVTHPDVLVPELTDPANILQVSDAIEDLGYHTILKFTSLATMESAMPSPPAGLLAVTGGAGTAEPARLHFADSPSRGWRQMVAGAQDDGLRSAAGQTWYFTSLIYDEALVVGSRGVQARRKTSTAGLDLLLNPFGGHVRVGATGSGNTYINNFLAVQARASVVGGTSAGAPTLSVDSAAGHCLRLTGNGVAVHLMPEAGGWLKLSNSVDTARYHLRVGAIDSNNWITTTNVITGSTVRATAELQTGTAADTANVKFCKNRAFLSYDIRSTTTIPNFAFSRPGSGLEPVWASNFNVGAGSPMKSYAVNDDGTRPEAEPLAQEVVLTAAREAVDLHDFADRIGACVRREYLPGEGPPGETEVHGIDLGRTLEALLLATKETLP